MQVSFTETELVDMILKTPKKHGVWNLFILLNETIGLKLCQSAELRDGNYTRQTFAAEHGYGPDTYGKTDVVIGGVKYYGYFTEVVEIPQEYEHPIYAEQIRELNKWACDNLFDGYWGDSKPANCGIKNGRLVIVDFDDLSSDDYNSYNRPVYPDELAVKLTAP